MELNGKNLRSVRGGREVFAGLNFGLKAGELLELRGPNGAGKTSLLRLIAGFDALVGGELILSGADSDTELGQYCHFVGHNDAFKTGLTVLENLRFWAAFFGSDDETAVMAGLEAFSLKGLASFSAGLLSAGQRRRLSLARLVAFARPLWLLDEPTVGLDTKSVGQLQAVIGRHLEGGGMVVATTHIDLGVKGALVFDFAKEGHVA